MKAEVAEPSPAKVTQQLPVFVLVEDPVAAKAVEIAEDQAAVRPCG
ncbi:MAG: hypothetical protein WBG36_13355 [Ornithinimicrobium sp.]